MYFKTKRKQTYRQRHSIYHTIKTWLVKLINVDRVFKMIIIASYCLGSCPIRESAAQAAVQKKRNESGQDNMCCVIFYLNYL